MSIKLLTPVDVVIDSRENSKHPEFREAFIREGLKVAVRELQAGDFLLMAPPEKKSILIERKSIDDLANSVKDNRIWEQSRLLLEEARRDGHQPLLVVEGCISSLEKYRGWRIQSILRVLDSLILDMGIPILNTPSKNATIAWITAKAKSLGRTESKQVFRMRVEKKPMNLQERILYVAEGVVGPVLARRLLEKFKTLRNLANASKHELLSVEGIGEKRAEEIYILFNTPWQSSEPEE